MKQYQELNGGLKPCNAWQRLSDMASFGDNESNTDRARMLKEIADGEAEVIAYVEPEKTWIEIRGERDMLLHDSDWMATSDRTLTDAQSAYRQALRDVPQNFATTKLVVWPTLTE